MIFDQRSPGASAGRQRHVPNAWPHKTPPWLALIRPTKKFSAHCHALPLAVVVVLVLFQNIMKNVIKKNNALTKVHYELSNVFNPPIKILGLSQVP